MTSGASARKTSAKPQHPVRAYLDKLTANLRTQRSTEHTHRAALVDLIQASVSGSRAINEPTREKYGAPDIVVFDGEVPVGYLECKDIGVSLDSEDSIEQIERYKANLKNIIHTDYLEFRWYKNGEPIQNLRLGTFVGDRVVPNEAEYERASMLFSQFYSTVSETITNSKQLAIRLAAISSMIRELIQSTLQFDDVDSKWLRNWKSAFQETLFKAIDDRQFADMFAQTLAHGFFSARMQAADQKYFSRLSAAHILPRTNPFLRKLFIQFAGPEMPSCINWATDELVKILKFTDRDAIQSEFSGNSGKSDPILHFYETFLIEYDPKLKVDKGVFYTPQPVVDFIVRGVDRLLNVELEKNDGLSDDNTIILDPAVGTGSFLKSAIDRIYAKKKANQGAWESYVNDSLLNRLFGFEVLMAPYSVAHLKIGIHLQSTGYKFSGDRRLGVFLTNTLEETPDRKEHLFIEALAQESTEAAKVKNDEPVMVIMGNPPYKGSSKNRGEWILNLIKDYKKDLKERKVNLDDDCVKFIRFSQWKIDKTGSGILAMITNNVFLDGITHRRMRQSLMESFDELFILNLHGSVQRRDECADGTADENVFDIPLGVSISFMVKKKSRSKKCRVRYASLQGSREYKYKQLSQLNLEQVEWTELEPKGHQFFFVQRNQDAEQEFSKFASLKDIFSLVNSGIQTKRDDVAIAFTEDELKANIRDFATLEEAELKTKYDLPEDGRDWKISSAQEHAKSVAADWSKLAPVLYRPFDIRWTVMDNVAKGFVAYPRYETMRHFLGGQNLGLITTRQLSLDRFQHVWAAKQLIDGNTISMQSREYNYVMPLYLTSDLGELVKERRPNFTRAFNSYLASLPSPLTPEQVFYYIYAVTSAPSYADKYNDLLKSDFARVPLTNERKPIIRLARYGRILVKLHTLDFPAALSQVTFPIAGDNKVGKIDFDAKNGRMYINETQFFQGVSESMRAAEVGGYHVFDRWFKSYKGRTLTHLDIEVVTKTCFALDRASLVLNRIDDYVDGIGGFGRLSATQLDLSLNTIKMPPKSSEKKRAARSRTTARRTISRKRSTG